MDSMSIDLLQSTITAIRQEGNAIHVRLEPAILIKTMTGSEERTKWYQNIELVFEDADLIETVEQFPVVCAGGDLYANVYTYRDMVPVPLESRGRIGCDFTLKDHQAHIRIQAEGIRLQTEDHPRYIEHIRNND